MSFSSEVKAELSAIQIKHRCCRRAFASGMLFDAETDATDRLLATFSTEETAQTARRAVNSAYGSNSAIGLPTPYGKNFDIAVMSPEAVNDCGKPPELVCGECAICFLRGLLISLSSITDPNSQYHLEFLVSNAEKANVLSDFLAGMFEKPLSVRRKSGVGVIYKNSTVIEDILSTSGATKAYFILLNGKIERDLRNNANRATNCETRNIERSVKATERQLDAINRLIAAGESDKLPPELRETAQLRILYPDLPLSELAVRHAPPITKSGINHRINKLLEAADKLK